MTALFGRVARLEVINARHTTIVDADRPHGLRIDFDILKSLKPEANTGIVVVWNLAPRTREKISAVVRRIVEFTEAEQQILRQRGASPEPLATYYDNLGIAGMRFSVGYAPPPGVPRTLGSLLEGSSERITHTRDGRDWRTEIALGDAEAVLREAMLFKSFQKGTPVIDVIAELVRALGSNLGPAQRALLSSKIEGNQGTVLHFGHAFSGNAYVYMQQFMKLLDVQWSLQEGEFVVLSNDPGELYTIPDPPLVVSSVSGMIGAPRRLEDDGVEVVMLCNSNAKPGRKLHLMSETITGLYRIEQVRHTGSTRSGPWQSTCELQRIGVIE
jgi:hypothetical protein